MTQANGKKLGLSGRLLSFHLTCLTRVEQVDEARAWCR